MHTDSYLLLAYSKSTSWSLVLLAPSRQRFVMEILSTQHVTKEFRRNALSQLTGISDALPNTAYSPFQACLP